jgi:hypothetical protein
MAVGLLAWLSACGRTRNDDEPEDVGGVASQGAGDSGAAGSGGSAGLQLAGSLSIAGDATGGSAGNYIAQPLEDTALCEKNLFERVEQLPDEAFSFTARFDGEPVEVRSSATPDASLLLGVFRFGPTWVEALNFGFEFGAYEGFIQVSAVECGHDGHLLKRQDGEVVATFALSSATLNSHTSSVDGFMGVSRGALYSEWANELGEKHVFEASFFMRAAMPGQRAERP